MKNQDRLTQMRILKKLYLLYEKAIEQVKTVCGEKCSSCCTCNVTLTGLEAEFLMAAVTQEEKKNLKNMIEQDPSSKRYVPKMTSNCFARMCMENKDIPEEENDPSWGKCPLLVDELCHIYEVRPFGCRALMSQVNCRKSGYAKMDPLVLTLNTVFLQIIEHLDEKGYFGNLSDMLTLFWSDVPCKTSLDCSQVSRDEQLLCNEKIPLLMVPPEHQEVVKPLLKKLSDLTGLSF